MSGILQAVIQDGEFKGLTMGEAIAKIIAANRTHEFFTVTSMAAKK